MRPLQDVSSSRGAPMGRSSNINDTEYPVEFEVERLQWVDGDYDQGGAYWGRSGETDYIYRACGESGDEVEEIFVRAPSLIEAKTEIEKTYPNATFAPSAELDSMVGAYVEAALWATTNERYHEDPENESEKLDDSGYELADAARNAMKADCADFLGSYGDLIQQAVDEHGYSIEQAGHDFFLTRSGHGVGFWDRGLGELGTKLTDASQAYGEADLYVGDDNLIHVDGEEPVSKPGM